MQRHAVPVAWLEADWPAPAHVRALTTLRGGGRDASPYAGLNLALHVGDQPERVLAHRRLIPAALRLPCEPRWLDQIHGTRVIDAGDGADTGPADGAYAARGGVVCAVLTADCLPLVLCNRAGSEVAALHCGWRGLAAGIIQAGVARFRSAPADLLAWLGPAIGPAAYEVSHDVLAAFSHLGRSRDEAFRPARPGHWLADLYTLARLLLREQGVNSIHGGGLCTWSEPGRFYSHRRDGVTGRMATLVWLDDRTRA